MSGPCWRLSESIEHISHYSNNDNLLSITLSCHFLDEFWKKCADVLLAVAFYVSQIPVSSVSSSGFQNGFEVDKPFIINGLWGNRGLQFTFNLVCNYIPLRLLSPIWYSLQVNGMHSVNLVMTECSFRRAELCLRFCCGYIILCILYQWPYI